MARGTAEPAHRNCFHNLVRSFVAHPVEAVLLSLSGKRGFNGDARRLVANALTTADNIGLEVVFGEVAEEDTTTTYAKPGR